MACEFLYNDTQDVALYSPVIFRSSIPCTRGFVIHEDETGNFILRGANTSNSCNQYAYYQVTFNGNIALPEDAEEVVPIAIALTVNGEPRYVSRAISTSAAGDFNNVTSTAIIKVPRCCCYSLGIESVPATTDPTVSPAPIIVVQNANLTISRVA